MRAFLSRNASKRTILFLILLSLLGLVAAVRYPPYLNDDAYISLTYAKNLARGDGFVFNHPPAVLGTTTPLFTLLVAGLAAVLPAAEIPVMAVYLSALCWLGIPWLLYFFRKAWRLEAWQVGVLALVLVASFWVRHLGMEAYPFAFLLVLSLSLFWAGRYGLAGFAIGLLTLTRGEGILILGVVLAALPIQTWLARKRLTKALGGELLALLVGFGLPVGVWALYAQLTFGSILPNTLAAKQALGSTAFGRPFLDRLIGEWLPFFGLAFKIEPLPWLNLWWVVVAVGLIDILVCKRRWLLFIAWVTLYILGYTYLGVSAYWWYQLPISFVLNLYFALGISAGVELLRKYLRHAGLSLSLSIVLVGLLVFPLVKYTLYGISIYPGDERGASYMALSSWLRENTAPEDSVAFLEIGYLGFYTDNRIFDFFGLVIPEVIPAVARGDFSSGFWQNQPEVYVHLPDFDYFLAGIQTDARFDGLYQPVATLPGPRSTDFTIYRKRAP